MADSTAPKKPLLLAAAVFVVAVLAALAGWTLHSLAISNAPVYVCTPTNLPPPFASIVGTNIHVALPYAQAPNKLVTPKDITEIRKCLPAWRTCAWFYRPTGITVDSPEEAHVDFWRRRMPLSIQIIKKDGAWKLERIQKGGQVCFSNPPDFWDEVSNRLPY